MLLRLSTLATGRTGVRPETAQAYAAMLDAGITPVVHEYGSLGCSGDLAPLSHVRARADGRGRGARRATATLRPAAEALRAQRDRAGRAGREGGPGADQRHRRHARHAACWRWPTCGDLLDDRRPRRGDERRGAARHRRRLRRRPAGPAPAPRPGRRRAANLRALLAGIGDHGQPPRPGVHPRAGRLLAALRAAGARRRPRHRSTTPRAVAGRELAAAIDNPVVTLDGRVESNGNFHGAPVGYVLDFLAIAVADVASMSERRTDRFLDVARSNGLPPFLADDPGVDSGHMIAQYTAAGIVCELKRLAVPASVDSIPSSAMQEDHVSMGWHAARKLRRAVDGLTRVLADRDAHRRPRARPARPARAGRRRPAPCGTPSARPASPAPAPTGTSPRRSRPSSSLRRGDRRPARPPPRIDPTQLEGAPPWTAHDPYAPRAAPP